MVPLVSGEVVSGNAALAETAMESVDTVKLS